MAKMEEEERMRWGQRLLKFDWIGRSSARWLEIFIISCEQRHVDAIVSEVSTKSIPGIYNPPYNDHLPRAFDKPIEPGTRAVKRELSAGGSICGKP